MQGLANRVWLLMAAAMVAWLPAGCVRTSVEDGVDAISPAPVVAPDSSDLRTRSMGAVFVEDATGAASGPSLQGGRCVVDSINGASPIGATAVAGSVVTVVGWLSDDASQVPAAADLLLVSERLRYAAPLSAGLSRPDVAKALEAPALQASGYATRAVLEVEPGVYALSIRYGAGNDSRACALGLDLDVVP